MVAMRNGRSGLAWGLVVAAGRRLVGELASDGERR
jgi:hypothetical protein